ncbi:MAG: hypothetical protein K6B44_13265 [Lachnospiraceae bacterium]|nr:hypothetical protein [Lachnospiraceae bacterium]
MYRASEYIDMNSHEEKKMGQKIVEILWTGGMDSTFRMCQLSRQDVTIKSYYLSAGKRKSEEYELEAMNSIKERLEKDPATKAVILEPEYVDMSERTKDEALVNSLQAMLKYSHLGDQYIYIGSFSKDHDGIELSIHKDDKALLFINKLGGFYRDEEGRKRLKKEGSDENLVKLFGYYSFPITEYSKVDMKKEFVAMGLEDVMNMTWFCHAPINGKPCGKCNPCMYTVEEGMAYRLDSEAMIRYRKQKRKKRIYRMKQMLKRILKRADQ